LTIDERQVRAAFRAGRDALAFTDDDVDRLQADLHQRIRADRHGSRRTRRASLRPWMVAAAVLALVAIVGVVAVTGTSPPRPAEGVPSGSVVGVWKGTDTAYPFIVVLRADGSLQSYSLSNGLLDKSSVSGSTFTADVGNGRYRVIGGQVEIMNAEDPGRDCEYGFTGQWIADGQLRLIQASQAGTDCGSPLPPVNLIRVSPASQAGAAYSAAATSPLYPVAGTNQLDGAWLLRGTGVILAIGWTLPSAGVPYSLDQKGTIDTAADDHGLITVPAPGRIVLTSAQPSPCATTVLKAASAGDYALTARVEADRCHRFAEQTDLTFTRLQ
jgi:hypothetical protein